MTDLTNFDGDGDGDGDVPLIDTVGRTYYVDAKGVPYYKAEDLMGDTSEYLSCGECGLPAKSRGLCGTHYQAARRGGYLDDYPLDSVYDAEWADHVIRWAAKIHGTEWVQERLE